MVELTRCPKCATLYDLEGIDLSASGGWVQCGECDRKFKAESYEIDRSEISYQASDSETFDSQEDSFDSQMDDVDRMQMNDILSNKESEFSDKAITTLPGIKAIRSSSEEFYEGVDDLFSADSIDDKDSNIHESEKLMELDNHREYKTVFEEDENDFEEEILLRPSNARKESLEKELEAKAFDAERAKNKPLFLRVIVAFCLVAIALSLLTVLAFQLQSRGTYKIISTEHYVQLLDRFPYLKQFEKSQQDLSSLHLASTRMEKKDDGLAIVLQLVNRSPLNQAYPDFQLEFTNSKGEIIARKLILPNMYLEKGQLGLLEAREARTVFLNLLSLPRGSVGYQIKVVQQTSS